MSVVDVKKPHSDAGEMTLIKVWVCLESPRHMLFQISR